MNVAGSGWIVTASGEAASPLGVGAVPWKATWTAAEGSVAGFRPVASRIPNSSRLRPTMVSDQGDPGRDAAERPRRSMGVHEGILPVGAHPRLRRLECRS